MLSEMSGEKHSVLVHNQPIQRAALTQISPVSPRRTVFRSPGRWHRHDADEAIAVEEASPPSANHG
jgi:hypothetical protein